MAKYMEDELHIIKIEDKKAINDITNIVGINSTFVGKRHKFGKCINNLDVNKLL